MKDASFIIFSILPYIFLCILVLVNTGHTTFFYGGDSLLEYIYIYIVPNENK